MWKTDKLGCCSYTLDITSILVVSTLSCSMDERDLPKAPLSLFHIVEDSVDVGNDGGDGWTEENGVEEEVEGRCGKFQIHNSTKFNHGQST